MSDDMAFELLKEAREHAWDWFSLHANQRMQAFNFFLVATGFLVAAYASAVGKLPLVACGVAMLGAWVTFWFSRLDARSRELVRAGEAALSACESQLAEYTGNAALRIVAMVEEPSKWVLSYSRAFDLIQAAIFVFFIVAGAYGYAQMKVLYAGMEPTPRAPAAASDKLPATTHHSKARGKSPK